MAASETVHGLYLKKENYNNKRSHSYFGAEEQEKNNRRRCAVCGWNHRLWACDGFKKMSVTERWNVAKQGKLCYRCLGNNHFDSGCTRTRICAIDGCSKSHNRLLHRTERKNLQGITKVDTKAMTVANKEHHQQQESYQTKLNTNKLCMSRNSIDSWKK